MFPVPPPVQSALCRRADLLAAESALVARLEVCERLNTESETHGNRKLHVVHHDVSVRTLDVQQVHTHK